MKPSSATALAHPNIAFIKYWGNRDDSLRLPANGSISMTLDELDTRVTVTWDAVIGSKVCLRTEQVSDDRQGRSLHILEFDRTRLQMFQHSDDLETLRDRLVNVDEFPAILWLLEVFSQAHDQDPGERPGRNRIRLYSYSHTRPTGGGLHLGIF